MINFYSYKNKSYITSFTLIILTVIIIFFKGLNLGIDFKGGLNFEVRTNLSNEQIFNSLETVHCFSTMLKLMFDLGLHGPFLRLYFLITFCNFPVHFLFI